MAYVPLLLAISLGAATLLGFAAHRGSICNVKAVEEVLSTRRAHLFLSFGKTILWSLLVTLALLFLIPAVRAEDGIEVSGISLAGGLICGIGMAINGSCAFATLSRLGELRMAVTLVAFFVGAYVTTLVASAAALPPPVRVAAAFDPNEIWVQGLLAVCALWALWEVARLVRTREPGASLLTNRYRLSTTALVIGATNGLLFSLYGNWTYTATLVRGARELAATERWFGLFEFSFLAALVIGMLLSAWQRRTFRLRLRPQASWLRNAFGGLLMGAGAVLVPGGNDTLLLHGIPNLSMHALLAYLAMVFGIVLILIAMRSMGQGLPHIDCRGDICRTS